MGQRKGLLETSKGLKSGEGFEKVKDGRDEEISWSWDWLLDEGGWGW